MPNPTIALTRCSDYKPENVLKAIKRQFDLLGGIERFVHKGDSVLLKPNFIAPRSRRHATQTHPSVIIETARLLKDLGARPFVGDSPAWGDVFSCVNALKIEEELKNSLLDQDSLFKKINQIINRNNIEFIGLNAEGLVQGILMCIK